ncbi:TonB-dependent receptor plug domain-containing protein [Gilvibacter sp.]|uniref:TonB-dependent receptor plug domain-containing protein n=1 Tax=Gilvibacter sp. TaxID=2729997 RepID=UPI0025C59C8C|nr:TonB-dependent receptor plug domain-containing protein [Gilvibacter sp.]NQX78616.1 TonB-dependent receptor [Gilvibacter sp.]
MKKILCITGMVLGFATVGFSQTDGREQALDTVFLDSKTPLTSANSGKVITTISAEQIAQEPNSSVAQLLNRAAGIEINGSRSNGGQNLGYFVRGGRNRQVVILIDGVQVNDPSQIANDFDLRLLPASAFEKIEVLKGASSVLYGSGAATAVISLTSKKNGDKVFGVQASTSLSTENSSENTGFGIQTFNNSARIGGGYKGWSYQMQIDHQSRTGLSAVAAPEGEPAFENDPFNSYSATATVGYAFDNGLSISRSFTNARFKAAFDNFDYTDANNLSTTQLEQLRGNLTYRYQKGRVVVNDAYSWTERDIESSFPSRFDSRFFAVDGFWNHQWSKQFSTVVGVNAQFSDFNSFSIPFGETEFNQDINDQTADFDIIDPYLNVVYQSDFGLNLNAGVRLNTHSNYDNAVVYHINPSYNTKLGDLNAKVLASYSTAYITPSLFQLFDPSFGNLELDPENNRTIEAGLAVGKAESFQVSVVYFNRLEEDFIDFVTLDPDHC